MFVWKRNFALSLPVHDKKFFDKLEKVMVDCHSALKDEKVLAWLIGDQGEKLFLYLLILRFTNNWSNILN